MLCHIIIYLTCVKVNGGCGIVVSALDLGIEGRGFKSRCGDCLPQSLGVPFVLMSTRKHSVLQETSKDELLPDKMEDSEVDCSTLGVI